MGGRRTGRVTRKDIAKAESLPALIGQLVKRLTDGNAEVKEVSVSALRSIATQDHREHADEVFKAGAVKPLVELLKIGTAEAQANGSGALAAIATKKPKHQKAIVDSGGVVPLVALMKTGSAKVQEEVRGRRAHTRPPHLPPCTLSPAPLLPARGASPLLIVRGG